MKDPALDQNRRLLNRTGAAVAGGLITILAGSFWMLVFHDLPKDNHDIILILVTTIANAVLMIVGYFFGTSVATSKQGEIIAQQADTIATAQNKLAPVPGAPGTPTVPVAPSEVKIIKGE